MIPFERCCSAEEDTIKKMISVVVNNYFAPSSENAKTFTILPQVTNNANYKKSKCIEMIAEKIEKPHKVDFKNAQNTILFFISKQCASIAVVTNFNEFSKYNVRLVQNKQQKETDDNKDD